MKTQNFSRTVGVLLYVSLLVIFLGGHRALGYTHQEVESVAKATFNLRDLNLSDVIDETPTHWILKTAIMNPGDAYYILKLPVTSQDLLWVGENSRIVDYQNGSHLVISTNSEDDIVHASTRAHELTGQCGSLQKISDQAMDFSVRQYPPLIIGKNADIEKLLTQVSLTNIQRDLQSLVNLGTRFHSHAQGKMAGHVLRDMYLKLVPFDRPDVSVALYDHSGSSQKSVVVTIQGTDFSNEKVILGSHLDSITYFDMSRAPGADDNASGTATNLEVFRVLMDNGIRPRRTIEIQAYAAEEIGLVGSGEIARAYKNKNFSVASMVQFDMNGYSKSGVTDLFLVTNDTNAALTDQLGEYITFYLPRPFQKKTLSGGSSDHASWHKQGFAAAFPTENPSGYNPGIHTSNDTVKGINDPEKMRLFGQLGVAYLLHYAGVVSR